MKKIIFGLIIVILITLIPLNGAVQAGTAVPTITIIGVTAGEKVTVKTHNFPADKDFEVRMGLFGTKGIDGILTATINSYKGGSLTLTFDIPKALSSEDLIAIRLESKTGGYYAYNWFENTDFGTHEGSVPAEEIPGKSTISITSVKKDSYAVIRGSSFPPNEIFDVQLGEYQNEEEDWILVDTIQSDSEGCFISIFDIPESLYSENKISILVEAKESDLEVNAQFENVTKSSSTNDDDTSTGTYTGIPTIAITSVTEDEEVTVKTHNFPANKVFKVLMGKMGTRGIGGVQVTTFNSGDGGVFTKTFDIPESLKGDYRIAIRLQTADGHFFAYNWFFNNTSTAGDSPSTGYTGIPTFSITAVDEDDTVTIKTHNFPANYDFKVLIGKMGTRGIGGVTVTTIDSGSGGAFTKTFDIPAAFDGDKRIAIRLEATSGGYYAYNWFYNSTYP